MLNKEDIKICILDFKSGNTKSVLNICNFLNVNTIVSNKNSEIASATHLIIPGVGSFDRVMDLLNQYIDINNLNQLVLDHRKPILGICIGMQIFSSFGYENQKKTPGLNYIQGEVKKMELDKTLALPQIGWNNVYFNEQGQNDETFKIFHDNEFYFLNSYYMNCIDQSNVVLNYDYYKKFTAVIKKNNIFGCQFHPEKSQENGIKFLKFFLKN